MVILAGKRMTVIPSGLALGAGLDVDGGPPGLQSGRRRREHGNPVSMSPGGES